MIHDLSFCNKFYFPFCWKCGEWSLAILAVHLSSHAGMLMRRPTSYTRGGILETVLWYCTVLARDIAFILSGIKIYFPNELLAFSQINWCYFVKIPNKQFVFADKPDKSFLKNKWVINVSFNSHHVRFNLHILNIP